MSILQRIAPPKMPRADSGPLAPPYERLRLRLYLALMGGDMFAMLAAYFLAGLFYTGIPLEERAMMQAQLLLPLFLTIGLYNRTYSIAALLDMRASVGRMVLALLVSAALLNFLAFYAKFNAQFSRFTFTIGLVLAAALMAGFRVVFMGWIRARIGARLDNVLVIADGGPAADLLSAYHLDARALGLSPAVDDPHLLDRLGKLMLNMDRVIVSCPPEKRAAWAFVLRCAGVNGEVVSEAIHTIGAVGVARHEEADMTTLIVSTGPLGLRSRMAKRLFDLGISGAALMLLMPVLLVTACAVKLQDGGPVLFRQRRLGRGNRFFAIYKFRTMRVDQTDADGARSAIRNDERVTRIGHFLRRSSLDELPQLFNVIKGEMSLVGPRPHALGSQAGDKLFWEVDRRYWQRHSLKPGLTGLAQVRGLRGATDCESDLAHSLQADLEYLHGWHIWRDLVILVRTLRVLAHHRAF